MKKFAKMSLAAAIAVAGLTNVNAASLEESIKGVDVSGQFRFRFNEINTDSNTNANGSETGSDVEIEVTAKVPVNDNVTAVFKIDNANDDPDTSVTKGGVTIEDYYFQYVNGPVTVLAGQQDIPGRMTDGNQGDGIVGLYNMGAFTVGAAAFANHDVAPSDNFETAVVPGVLTQTEFDAFASNFTSRPVYSVIAMGSVGPVSLLGQYASVKDVTDSYNLKADATVGPVMLGLEYTESNIDNELEDAFGVDDYSTFKAYVSGSMGIVSAKLAYAATGDDGSGSIDNILGRSSIETPAEWLLWNLGTANNADMDVWALDASVAVTDKISLRAAYADGEIGNGKFNDVEEILGQVTYKMSSNLTSYIRYSEYDASGANDNDNERARVEVKYTF